ncbi:MAG: chromate transporter [Oscillospiraceae bacterium]|nr:chromate transporter [Oscillospiraceae bacterium]
MPQIFLLFDLFITFFQIGLFTIGGGYAMIPLITDKVVSKGWCTEVDLLDYIAVAESTPGPFAINTSTFIGMKQFGIPGVIVSCLGLILPSFIIILIIAKFFMKFVEYRGVSAALNGLRPAVIGLMSAAVISIAIKAFNININFNFINNLNFTQISIFIIVLALSQIEKLKINSYKIIILSAVLGIMFYTAKDFGLF